MSLKPVQSGSTGVFKAIPSFLRNQWQVHRIRTSLFACGAIGVVAILAFRSFPQLRSIFSSPISRPSTRSKGKTLDGLTYGQSIIHVNPSYIFGSSLSLKDPLIEVELIYRGQTRDKWKLYTLESRDIYLQKLPVNEAVTLQFKAGQRTESFTGRLDSKRHHTLGKGNAGVEVQMSTALDETKQCTMTLNPPVEINSNAQFNLTADDNITPVPLRSGPPKWRFENKIRGSYQACVLGLSGQKGVPDFGGDVINVAISFALTPGDNIEIRQDELQRIWEEAYLLDKKAQPSPDWT